MEHIGDVKRGRCAPRQKSGLNSRQEDRPKVKAGLEEELGRKKQGVQIALEEELERLKLTMSIGYDLKVRYIPNGESKLSGEVRGTVIYVYEEDEGEAIETLKHEFIDHHITKEIVEPLVEYVNIQKSLIERLIYKRKEGLVDSLSKLL
ncbi:MAG: hypothetical protein V1915_03310 [Candidatus Bathyarchaeota archaeon]